MKRAYYYSQINHFIEEPSQQILGEIARNSLQYQILKTERSTWEEEIIILKQALRGLTGHILFEYDIPRMGRRVDVLLITDNALFILEFKVGESDFNSSAIDQVYDYALDLKNFHEESHDKLIVPILVATQAKISFSQIQFERDYDLVSKPILTNSALLRSVIDNIVLLEEGTKIDANKWVAGRYSPTPTIIEAAVSLFNKHSVAEITRTDAAAVNLSQTSKAVSGIIEKAKQNGIKAICFVTGVPGAGKTLVGLDVATKHLDQNNQETSVFLSGNGPLVDVLREALTRNRVYIEKEQGRRVKKSDVFRQVKMFIQNVHHFRDECLRDDHPPKDHVAIFDEAQRAWNHAQTESFMKRKRNQADFAFSEPEFLISCLDRHKDWAVVVCLVGGGQEIHTGEAGIREWIESINHSFPDWKLHISSKLMDSEYDCKDVLSEVNTENVRIIDQLHLSVSMRSFRAEHLSKLIKNVLDIQIEDAQCEYLQLKDKYPIVITRSLQKAKDWLKSKARGSERFGLVVSSQASRLKPLAIDIRVPTDPIHWFLNGKDDVRSSYYLEDAATEFQVQGLELDWTCVTWDADFRFDEGRWKSFSFVSTKWHNIHKEERKQYLKNAYRVLLTRARQGMVIVIPGGDVNDPTRNPDFYNPTFEYLSSIGFEVI